MQKFLLALPPTPPPRPMHLPPFLSERARARSPHPHPHLHPPLPLSPPADAPTASPPHPLLILRILPPRARSPFPPPTAPSCGSAFKPSLAPAHPSPFPPPPAAPYSLLPFPPELARQGAVVAGSHHQAIVSCKSAALIASPSCLSQLMQQHLQPSFSVRVGLAAAGWA